MTRLCCRIITLLLAVLVGRTANAWSECGHHIISLVAIDLLGDAEQERLISLLKKHPRFDEDFEPPESIQGQHRVTRWQLGRVGYWPDIARQLPDYDRPTWHYQLGATLTIGNPAALNLPAQPGPCPPAATLQTQQLYIAQAVELCRRVMRARSAPAADRAIAMTWLAHLVGDAHQPCHAGSLYAEHALPDGDRGGNSIPVKPDRNMHWVWDDLLGRQFDEERVRHGVAKIARSRQLQRLGQRAATSPTGLDPLTWLQESREAAVKHVYSEQALQAVTLVSRGLTDQVPPLELSQSYLKRAARVARSRAALAAYRLAAIWREGLEE